MKLLALRNMVTGDYFDYFQMKEEVEIVVHNSQDLGTSNRDTYCASMATRGTWY